VTYADKDVVEALSQYITGLEADLESALQA
jgi:hypothetical protein